MFCMCLATPKVMWAQETTPEVPVFTFPDGTEEDTTEATTAKTKEVSKKVTTTVTTTETVKATDTKKAFDFDEAQEEIEDQKQREAEEYFRRPPKTDLWIGYGEQNTDNALNKVWSQYWTGDLRYLQKVGRIYSGVHLAGTKVKGNYESKDSMAFKTNFKGMEWKVGISLFWQAKRYSGFGYVNAGVVFGKINTEDLWTTGVETYKLWYVNLEWNANYSKKKKSFNRTDINGGIVGELNKNSEKTSRFGGPSPLAGPQEHRGYYYVMLRQNILSEPISNTGSAITLNVGGGYQNRNRQDIWTFSADIAGYTGITDFFRLFVQYDSWQALNKEVITAGLNFNIPLTVRTWGKIVGWW